MDLEEIKSRINPQYQDVLGTESYERKWLCDEIERLRHELAGWETKLQTNGYQRQLDDLNGELAAVTKERDEHWEVRKKRGDLIDRLQVQLITCQKERDELKQNIRDMHDYMHKRIADALAKLGADKEGDVE